MAAAACYACSENFESVAVEFFDSCEAFLEGGEGLALRWEVYALEELGFRAPECQVGADRSYVDTEEGTGQTGCRRRVFLESHGGCLIWCGERLKCGFFSGKVYGLVICEGLNQ